MAKFTYNNAKNTSTGYTLFELNCGFYSQASYKKDIDLCSMSKLANSLVTKLKELMIVYRESLQYI